MAVRPLQDRILVRREETKKQTEGGIFLPDSATEKPQEGKVVAVGQGKVTPEGNVLALEVKVGDRIMFGKYSGSEIDFDGETHLIMRQDDVMAVVE